MRFVLSYSALSLPASAMLPMLKEPLVQFLLIGACIYAAYGLFGTPDEDAEDRTIVVDSARMEGFIAQWQQRWNRPPTRQELDGIVDSYVRESILYRAAVEMGLDQDDPITRRRIAQKLEFLTNDIALFKEPTEEELRQYFDDNRASFREADRITFSQIFLDPDRRADATLHDAAALLAQLEAAGAPDAGTLNAGDSFMVRGFFEAASELDVRRELGSEFAERVMQLAPGRWHGPILSGFGVHLVYVYDFSQAPEAEFDDVRDAVLADWQEQQQEEFSAEFFDNLKVRYEVVIADPPEGALLQVPGDDARDSGSPLLRAPAEANPAT